MIHIYNAASCLVDLSKDDMHNTHSVLSVEVGEGDQFNQQIQRFDVKYGKNIARQDDLLSGLSELFINNNNQDMQITSD